MVLRLLSKFDLRRLCQTVGATALPRIVSFFLDFTGQVFDGFLYYFLFHLTFLADRLNCYINGL